MSNYLRRIEIYPEPDPDLNPAISQWGVDITLAAGWRQGRRHLSWAQMIRFVNSLESETGIKSRSLTSDVLLTCDNARRLRPNCQDCIDCQQMAYMHQTSWRCYGHHSRGGEMKRDICIGVEPPSEAPMWCPKRFARQEIPRGQSETEGARGLNVIYHDKPSKWRGLFPRCTTCGRTWTGDCYHIKAQPYCPHCYLVAKSETGEAQVGMGIYCHFCGREKLANGETFHPIGLDLYCEDCWRRPERRTDA